MRVVVAGSRENVSASKVAMELTALRRTLPITEVVSGAAPGVDSFGEQWVRVSKVPVQLFPAKWKRPDGTVDKGAGFKRNAQMADYAEALIAFWDGKSRGTKHMIELAASKGLLTIIFNVSTDNMIVEQYN
jgi:hypothetical protein